MWWTTTPLMSSTRTCSQWWRPGIGVGLKRCTGVCYTTYTCLFTMSARDPTSMISHAPTSSLSRPTLSMSTPHIQALLWAWTGLSYICMPSMLVRLYFGPSPLAPPPPSLCCRPGQDFQLLVVPRRAWSGKGPVRGSVHQHIARMPCRPRRTHWAIPGVCGCTC